MMSILPAVTFAQAQDFTQQAKFVIDNCGDLTPGAVNTALKAYQNATAKGLDSKGILTIVDFTRPSDQQRLCTVDLINEKVLYNGRVAQGVRTGVRYAEHFSNKPESNQSSIGLYKTGQTYYGVKGYSMRLQGLEAGFNNNVAKRNIVMHGLPN